jgi:hypothetical protein
MNLTRHPKEFAQCDLAGDGDADPGGSAEFGATAD